MNAIAPRPIDQILRDIADARVQIKFYNTKLVNLQGELSKVRALVNEAYEKEFPNG